MKRYNALMIAAAVLFAVIITAADLMLSGTKTGSSGQERVELSRVEKLIEKDGENADISQFETITAVRADDGSEGFFEGSDYIIRKIDGTLYRIELIPSTTHNGSTRAAIDLMLILSFAAVLLLLWHIRQNIIRPFERLSDLPAQLAKGSLTVPLKENKSRYFGKFIWGLDNLRETLEQSRQRKLEFQKDRRTLTLSLSHDIKTPLSAIKLYSTALARGLYKDPDKQKQTAVSIGEKADEIESYISRIVKASSEDIISLSVSMGEHYLSKITENIREYYTDKLSLNATEFTIGSFTDCLLACDVDRLTEVLQNIMENAIKYGDGKRIALSFSEEDDCRLISVTNSGCTLPPSELTGIFESFHRGSNAEGKKGSGLGLYICRQLMHKMGGEIFAEISDGDMIMTVACKKCF